jgi:hypothetical protein
MPLTGAQRQALYRARLKGSAPVVPFRPPVVALGPLVITLGPSVVPLGPLPLFLGLSVVPLVLHLAPVPVVPLAPPQLAQAVPINSGSQTFQRHRPGRLGLWHYQAIRDIRINANNELSFKLRWKERRLDGGQYKDSWVHERAIPNKGTLFKWLHTHGPSDSVLKHWMPTIRGREQQLIVEIN